MNFAPNPNMVDQEQQQNNMFVMQEPTAQEFYDDSIPMQQVDQKPQFQQQSFEDQK